VSYHGEAMYSADSRELNFGLSIPSNATDNASADAHAEATGTSNESVYGGLSGSALDAKGARIFWYDFCVVVQNTRTGLQKGQRLRVTLPAGANTPSWTNNRPSGEEFVRVRGLQASSKCKC
jgi:hypothetical protein